MAINVTIDGTTYEDINTITVGGKTLLLAYAAGSSGGDSGGSGEDSGGNTEVAMEAPSTTISCELFSDNGSTSLLSSDYRPVAVSAEAFTEDTVVSITFNLTGAIGTRKAYACCIPNDYSLSNAFIGHYTAELGTLNSIENEKYTVKAGYKLACVQASTPTQGTFTVTKGA